MMGGQWWYGGQQARKEYDMAEQTLYVHRCSQCGKTETTIIDHAPDTWIRLTGDITLLRSKPPIPSPLFRQRWLVKDEVSFCSASCVWCYFIDVRQAISYALNVDSRAIVSEIKDILASEETDDTTPH